MKLLYSYIIIFIIALNQNFPSHAHDDNALLILLKGTDYPCEIKSQEEWTNFISGKKQKITNYLNEYGFDFKPQVEKEDEESFLKTRKCPIEWGVYNANIESLSTLLDCIIKKKGNIQSFDLFDERLLNAFACALLKGNEHHSDLVPQYLKDAEKNYGPKKPLFNRMKHVITLFLKFNVDLTTPIAPNKKSLIFYALISTNIDFFKKLHRRLKEKRCHYSSLEISPDEEKEILEIIKNSKSELGLSNIIKEIKKMTGSKFTPPAHHWKEYSSNIEKCYKKYSKMKKNSY